METPPPPATPDDDLELTLDELAQRVGTSTRTIRFYIAQGLLPGPGTRGKAASYGAEHLVRLRLIRLLGARYVPLAEILALLAGLTLGETRELLAAEEERSDQLRAAEVRQSPRDYVSALLDEARQGRQAPPERPRPPAAYSPRAKRPSPSGPAERPLPAPGTATGPREAQAWSRWVLAPGVELHVRADARETWRELIRRLLLAAGALVIDHDDDKAGDR
ncbi:MAG TPA: MerR family transcriptional regulator [Ktedonobacterales bacterium]|nr:MerR family transcriptional regulator [Ktedonobacterales bacterium]